MQKVQQLNDSLWLPKEEISK